MEENKPMTIAECQIDTIKHIENLFVCLQTNSQPEG